VALLVYSINQKFIKMEKLVKKAKVQLKKSGVVSFIIYPDRAYEESYKIIAHTIEEALEVIEEFFFSQSDDISIEN